MNPGNAPTGQSWWVVNSYGQGNIYDLTANQSPFQPNLNFMIRAMALDCNGNGVWDQCDIDSAGVVDTNSNGIPDECEPPCTVDVDGDNLVDIDDLLAVINAWGACAGKCPADVNADGVVNVDDLLAVIDGWGTCV